MAKKAKRARTQKTSVGSKGQKKVAKVMREFHAGKLKSSSGQKVTNPKRAAAIGYSYSEARRGKKKKK